MGGIVMMMMSYTRTPGSGMAVGMMILERQGMVFFVGYMGWNLHFVTHGLMGFDKLKRILASDIQAFS